MVDSQKLAERRAERRAQGLCTRLYAGCLGQLVPGLKACESCRQTDRRRERHNRKVARMRRERERPPTAPRPDDSEARVLTMYCSGLTRDEVARAVGLQPHRVSRIIRDAGVLRTPATYAVDVEAARVVMLGRKRARPATFAAIGQQLGRAANSAHRLWRLIKPNRFPTWVAEAYVLHTEGVAWAAMREYCARLPDDVELVRRRVTEYMHYQRVLRQIGAPYA